MAGPLGCHLNSPKRKRVPPIVDLTVTSNPEVALQTVTPPSETTAAGSTTAHVVRPMNEDKGQCRTADDVRQQQDKIEAKRSKLDKRRSKLEECNKKYLEASLHERKAKKAAHGLATQCKELEAQLSRKRKELEVALGEEKEASRKRERRDYKRRICEVKYESLLHSLGQDLDPGTTTISPAQTPAIPTLSKRAPPLKTFKGKEGDTMDWKGTRYLYCSFDHKGGHWVALSPENCNDLKQQLEQQSTGSPQKSSRSTIAKRRQGGSHAKAQQGKYNGKPPPKKFAADTIGNMTRDGLIKLAESSENEAKKKLIRIVTTTPLEVLRDLLRIPAKVDARGLDNGVATGLMRVLVKGSFHLRPDFRDKIHSDSNLKNWLISKKLGLLYFGNSKEDKQNRLMVLLDLV